MRVLVLGSGGREHALIKALKEDPKTEQVYTLPERVSLNSIESLPSSLEPEDLATHLLKKKIDLVVIGPEQPLVNGLADALRSKGIKVFGPSQQAAKLEGSKIFAKEFMKELGIPTASYHVVSSVTEVLKSAENFFPPYVLKADGLAGGKGVFICKSLSELEQKSRFLFEEKALGTAGEKALLEDFQKGEELSVFIITNGDSYQILPVAQDYKRLLEANKGPNTGGMGAIAPVPINQELFHFIESRIIKPSLEGLKQKGFLYRGILYIGLMIHKNIPKVLEYNVRWGDPEAQVILPLLEGSWLDVFYQTALGQAVKLQWKKDQYSACIVLASKNYPESPSIESTLKGSLDFKTEQSYFIHGSLKKEGNQWITKGGRVLNAIGLGSSQKEALEKAYKQAEKISWEGIKYRRDIGQ